MWADNVYAERKEGIRVQFEKKIYKEFRLYGTLTTAVFFGNIDLLSSIEQAIQQKIQAKQEAERMEHAVQKEEARDIARANQIIGESLRNNSEYIQL